MNQESQIVAFHESIKLFGRVVARSGGTMPVFHVSVGAKHRWPTLLPRPVTQIEILHVGRIKDLAHTAERKQLCRIEQRAASAAVENPGEVFAGYRLVAAHRKIQRGIAAPNS